MASEVSGQSTLTVANGTVTAHYFPVSAYHWSQEQQSQSLYPASMLSDMEDCYITALTWYLQSAPSASWNGTQTVRIGTTTASNLSNGLVASPATVCWSGQLSAYIAGDTLRIPLEVPFLYTGGNLVVEISKPSASGGYGNSYFYGQNQPFTMSINQMGSYYAPYEGSFLPKLTFSYQEGGCSNPEALTTSGISDEEATLSWSPGIVGAADHYLVALRQADGTFNMEMGTTDTFMTVSGLSHHTQYYWKVRAVCTDTDSSAWSVESTFTTQRQLATVPYFCDFEDTTENVNWGASIPNPVWINATWGVGTYVSYSGNHSLYVSHDNGATNITDPVMSSFSNTWAYRDFYLDPIYPQYVLSFKHRGYGRTTPFFGPPDNAPFYDDYLMTPSGATRLSSSASLPWDSIWMNHSYTFTVDTPGVYRLYFRWYMAYEENLPGISIDDISITGIPCLAPNTLTATDITDTSATLTWQHDCVDEPMGYIVGYKTPGDYNYTEFTVYGTNTVTLTGLSFYTDYYWRVKTLYNDTVSTEWSSPATFRTDVISVHPLPYTCDFEDAIENLAWNVPSVSGNNVTRWYLGHNTYHSSNTSLYVSTKSNGSDNTWITSSESDIWAYRDIYLDPDYTTYELTLDAKAYAKMDSAYFSIYVGAPVEPSDSAAETNMTQLGESIFYTGGGNTPVWKHFEYSIDNSFAGHRRIFFRWRNLVTTPVYNVNVFDNVAIAIDDISITGTNCGRPFQPTATPFDTYAQLSWKGCLTGNLQSYTLAYKSATDTAYTEVQVNDTTYTLTGLLPLTAYTWKVRTNCSGEEFSEWSTGNDFETFQSLAVLPYSFGFEDSLETAAWKSYSYISPNKWCFGSAVCHNGQNASYISKTNGATYETNNPDYTDAYLYRDFVFDTTFSEYVLNFDFKTFDALAQPDIQVYAESAANPNFTTPSEGNLVGTIGFSDTLWHPVSIVINRTHGGMQRLVFSWVKDNYYASKGSCAVDDISLTGVMFGRPFALKSSDIDHESALLSWRSGNRYVQTSYQMAYRPANSTTFTTITVTDTFFHVTSLIPAMQYIWKVRAIADDGTLSAWSDETSFHTAASLPYETGFEDEIDNLRWEESSTWDDYQWIIGGATSYDGAHSLYITNDGGLSNHCSSGYYSSYSKVLAWQDIYFTPGATEYQISFYYLGAGMAENQTSFDYSGVGMAVLYGNPGDVIDNAVQLGCIPTSEYWRHHRLTADSSLAGMRRLYFLRTETPVTTDRAGAIDNLLVDEVHCPAPEALTATLTAHNAARLTWHPADGNVPQGYTLAYKPQYDHDYTLVTNLQDTVFQLDGLMANTPYFWKVRANCPGSGTAEWSSDNAFSTMPPLPYFYDFEDNVEKDFWTYDSNSAWNHWSIGAAPMDNGNTTLHIGSSYGDGNYNYYSTARLWAYRDLFVGGDGTRCQLSFDFRGMGQTDVDFARVYLGPPATSSGLNAPDGAVQIGDNFGMVPQWRHYSFEVDSAHFGLQRLYFQWRCDSYSGLNPAAAFDNISLLSTDCAIPINPAVVTVTGTTATLSWHPGDPNSSPASYTVGYRLYESGTLLFETTTDTVLTITGLQPDSRYYWMVRANCNADDSSAWSESGTFATSQSMYATLPYECDFEYAPENGAWTLVNLEGNNEWYFGTATAHYGNASMYVTSDGGASNTFNNAVVSKIWAYRDILLTPGDDEYVLEFDFKGMGTNNSANAFHSAKVFIGSPNIPMDATAPEGAIQLGTALYNIADWQHFSFHLPSSMGGMKRLYILWSNNTYSATQPAAAFDNISVMVSSCLPPSSLTADPVDTFSATIHFADPQHEDWDVAIAAGGGIPDESALLTLHGTPWYTFTGLDSGTVYTVFVRAHCDGEELSEWATTTFTTLSAADTTQNGGGGDTTGVAHYADLPSVKIYPNPANEHLNVLVSGTSPVTSIELFDVFGKIVRTIDACHSTNSHTIRINTGGLAPGVYFVRVVTDAGKTTKRFVKR